MCSYPVDPADFILSSKPAEVELRTLVSGAEFELGGIEFKFIEHGIGGTTRCQHIVLPGVRRELFLPSHIKVTLK